MTNYKLIRFEPTPEMVEAAEDAYMPFGDMDLAIRMALLTAPDVQGEPVAYAVFSSNGNILWCADPFQVETLRQEYGGQLQPLYTHPQLAEQKHPKSSVALEAATHLTNWLDMNWCECEGGHTCGYTDVKRTRDALLVAAEQQPELAKYQPSGCAICTCDHETQCQGCAPTFQLGDHVRKTKGSQWKGRVVGTYSTTLTPEGYAVESDTEKGSVQIYPVGALELVGEDAESDVEALDASTHRLHTRPDGERNCRCGQCRFVWLRDAALAAYRKGAKP